MATVKQTGPHPDAGSHPDPCARPPSSAQPQPCAEPEPGRGAGSLAWAVVPAPAPVDALTVVVSDEGLVRLAFGADPGAGTAAAARLGGATVEDPLRTRVVTAQLADYLAGRRTAFDLPLDWRLASAAARPVLRTLHATVPFGRTVTYGELAARSGLGTGYEAARGVGAAMGANPLPVVVPCHRVLAAGGLGGFGGGRAVKEWLLALEGVLPAALDLPPTPPTPPNPRTGPMRYH